MVSKDSDLKIFGNRMQLYDDLNLPRLDSLILILKHRFGHSDALLHNVCNILESYVVRRMLCVKDTKDIYKEINSFFFKVLETSKFDVNDFVNFLCNSLDSTDRVKNALNQAWSVDDNLVLYILYRIELSKREQSSNLYAPLSFKDLETRERIVSPVESSDYYATESIGNMIPLKSSLDDWDFCSLTAKKRLLVKEIAIDLILSEEVHDEDGWDTNPVAKIRHRAQDLLSHFDGIWCPILTDYI